jgi:hypothetical protein
VYQQPKPGDWISFQQDSPARLHLTNDFFWFTRGKTALVVSSQYHLYNTGEETLLVLIEGQLWWIDVDDVDIVRMHGR